MPRVSRGQVFRTRRHGRPLRRWHLEPRRRYADVGGLAECKACPGGKYSDVEGATECTGCNAANQANGRGDGFYTTGTSGLEAHLECECQFGYTGAYCDVTECPEVHPASSLGSMILMASPSTRKALGASASDDLVTLTAKVRNTLQECDHNSDNVLSGAEAKECLANHHVIVEMNRFVKMSVDDADGTKVKMTHGECAAACADADMSLPCLSSQHQNDLLLAAMLGHGLTKTEHAWIGYSSSQRSYARGGWAWPPQCESTFENWHSLQAGNANQRYPGIGPESGCARMTPIRHPIRGRSDELL